MITLITGLPGAGKTLYALCLIKGLAELENREVYFDGINDLKLPWIEHPLEDWPKLPPRSMVVCDEIQRKMRPRANGSAVPEFIAQMETHRHNGVDLFFITQHPMMLDQNVRRLVGRHLHVVRKYGTLNATIHEWPSIKDNCDRSRRDSIKHAWRYQKEAFGWYKSAEAHTVKRRVPAKLYAMVILPVLGVAAVGFMIARPYLAAKEQPQAQVAKTSTTATPVSGGTSTQRSNKTETLTRAQYVEQFSPRVEGLAYTAPVYDEITKPVRAPFPAACASSASVCRCYSQQATVLEVPKALCQAIVGKGFFVAFDQREPPENRHQAVERLEKSEVFRPEPPLGLVNLGGPGAEVARLKNAGVR